MEPTPKFCAILKQPCIKEQCIFWLNMNPTGEPMPVRVQPPEAITKNCAFVLMGANAQAYFVHQMQYPGPPPPMGWSFS